VLSSWSELARGLKGPVLLLAALLACKGLEQQTLQASDGISQITKPARWRSDPKLHENEQIGMAGPGREAFVIVLTDTKEDLAKPGLQAFSDLTRGHMRKTAQGYAESEPTELSVNTLPAIRYRIDASVDGVNVTYLHYAIAGRRHMHQVLAWSARSRFSAYRPELEKIAGSFRER
jgi:hypothetical protein